MGAYFDNLAASYRVSQKLRTDDLLLLQERTVWKKGQSGNLNGRPRGSLNKFAMENAQRIAESGELPVDYLVSVYRDDEADAKLRVDAARAAAPYLHPRLATSEVDIVSTAEPEHMTDEELIAIIKGDKAA